jgi:hypothetical protein
MLACAVALGLSPPGVGQDGHGEHAEPPQQEHADDGDGHESASRFPDEPIPLKLEGFPQRPKPILELGAPFLGTGPLDPGIEMPGGATWQPSLLVYGTYRTAVQTFDDGPGQQLSEWVNRLDLFANLQLTGTERVLFGFRPLDQDNKFSGYYIEPDDPRLDGWHDELNGRLTTLFFEGDFGEMFPDLDRSDFGSADWGISVGRQPLVFQEGLLINDTLDGVALVRDTLYPPGGSDLKLTFFYAWDNIDRNDNLEDNNAQMLAVFSEGDFGKSTIQADLVYVYDGDEGDGFYWGAGAIQRIGQINTAFRALGSYAIDDENEAVSNGHLLFGEVSWTPHHTFNNFYINGFWGIDQFASAARAPDAGGPLGRTGLMFAAVGLGRYGAPLGNRPDDAVGGAVGYQMFFDETRKQLVVEAGVRARTKSPDDTRFAIGARYQQALGQHTILRLDGFGSFDDDGDNGYGARVELQVKF